MTNLYHLYIDDSGTRHPDRKPGRIPGHGYDYFALGGILVKEDNEDEARALYKNFCEKWKIEHPLHSSEIRRKAEHFAFIGKLSPKEQTAFYEELYCLMKDCPVTGIGCVIDRPGYNHRYAQRYGQEKWQLCKTAFHICVERAAKYAAFRNCKLKVFAERCNKKEDARLKQYYNEMKIHGLPFDKDNSEKYAPLGNEMLRNILCDFKPKNKTSPMTQLADLYLWPICMGGYDKNNRPYKRLKEDGKLIDCILDEEKISIMGIKYSCWDLVEKTKARKTGL